MICFQNIQKSFSSFKTKLSLLHRNIYYMGLVGLLMNFGSTFVYTTLLIFVGGKDNIFQGDTLIIIRNVAEASANFSKIFGGYLSDKMRNRKLFLLVGYGAMLFTKICFTLLTFKDFFPLLFLQGLYIFNQVFDRCMNAVRDPARDALLMEASTPETRGISFSFRKIITSLGSILGGCVVGLLLMLWTKSGVKEISLYKWIIAPIMSLLIIMVAKAVKKNMVAVFSGLFLLILSFFVNRIQFSSTLYIASILPIILSFVLVKVRIQETKKTKQEKKDKISLRLIRDNLSKMKILFLLLGVMCFLTIGKLNDFCIYTRGVEMGMPTYSVPFMFAILYVIIIMFSSLFGSLVDRKKPYLTLLILCLCLLGGNLLLGMANSYFVFWSGLFCMGGYLAASDSALASIITFFIPHESMKATVYGLFYGVSGFLAVVNALLVGFLQKKYGLKYVYLLSTTPALLALLILIFSYPLFLKNYKNIKVID